MSTPLPLAWWSPQDGFAGVLEPVSSAHPGQAQVGDPAPRQGTWLVGVAGQAERAAARIAIRQAVRTALSALLAVDETAIDLPAAPGEAPYALVEAGVRGHAARRIPLAISHDEALSVAAIGLDGPVGIDVMRIQDIPDWEALARDYLGPAAARTLAGVPADARPPALARAWSEHEARLKCLGLPLTEWQAEQDVALQACVCFPLSLPDGYVGTLAQAPAAHR